MQVNTVNHHSLNSKLLRLEIVETAPLLVRFEKLRQCLCCNWFLGVFRRNEVLHAAFFSRGRWKIAMFAAARWYDAVHSCNEFVRISEKSTQFGEIGLRFFDTTVSLIQWLYSKIFLPPIILVVSARVWWYRSRTVIHCSRVRTQLRCPQTSCRSSPAFAFRHTQLNPQCGDHQFSSTF